MSESANEYLRVLDERNKLRLDYSNLQDRYNSLVEDYRLTAGLRGRIKELKADAKRMSENARITKLKARIKKLETMNAEERSLRMQSENKPEIERERDALKTELDTHKRDFPARMQGIRKNLNMEVQIKSYISALKKSGYEIRDGCLIMVENA